MGLPFPFSEVISSSIDDMFAWVRYLTRCADSGIRPERGWHPGGRHAAAISMVNHYRRWSRRPRHRIPPAASASTRYPSGSAEHRRAHHVRHAIRKSAFSWNAYRDTGTYFPASAHAKPASRTHPSRRDIVWNAPPNVSTSNV